MDKVSEGKKKKEEDEKKQKGSILPGNTRILVCCHENIFMFYLCFPLQNFSA